MPWSVLLDLSYVQMILPWWSSHLSIILPWFHHVPMDAPLLLDVSVLSSSIFHNNHSYWYWPASYFPIISPSFLHGFPHFPMGFPMDFPPWISLMVLMDLSCARSMGPRVGRPALCEICCCRFSDSSKSEPQGQWGGCSWWILVDIYGLGGEHIDRCIYIVYIYSVYIYI